MFKPLISIGNKNKAHSSSDYVGWFTSARLTLFVRVDTVAPNLYTKIGVALYRSEVFMDTSSHLRECALWRCPSYWIPIHADFVVIIHFFSVLFKRLCTFLSKRLILHG